LAHCGLLRHIKKKISLQTSVIKDETNSMEEWSSSEDTDQEIPTISFPCLQEPATGTIMGQMNPIHDLASYFLRPSLRSSHTIHLGLQSCPFPSGFPTKILCAFHFCLILVYTKFPAPSRY